MGTTEFFFRHIAGIQQETGSRGFSMIVFSPSILLTPSLLSICQNVSSVNATLRRPHGDIKAAWHCSDQGISYSVSTPVSVPAMVRLPLSSKSETTTITFYDEAGNDA